MKMEAYIRCADTIITMLATQKDLTTDELNYFMEKIEECNIKAAEAGGFLRTKDFIKWMNEHKAIT